MWTTSLVINMFMWHVQWVIMKIYTPRVVFRQHYFSKHIYKHNSYHKFPNTLFYNVHVSTMQLIFSYAILFMKNMLSKFTYSSMQIRDTLVYCVIKWSNLQGTYGWSIRDCARPIICFGLDYINFCQNLLHNCFLFLLKTARLQDSNKDDNKIMLK